MKIINTKKNKGFTLIELMVSISIFSIIMLTAIGSFLITLNVAKNARALRFAMDNVNFAMESMTRSIRMGKNYYCPSIPPGDGSDTVFLGTDLGTADCPNGATFIAFVPQKANPAGSYIAYRQRRVKEDFYTLDRCDKTGTCVPTVSSDVNVKKLNFIVKGSSDSDDLQPSAYIIMQGEVMVRGKPVSFAIQTLASQRNF